jgi:hypothetical protein
MYEMLIISLVVVALPHRRATRINAVVRAVLGQNTRINRLVSIMNVAEGENRETSGHQRPTQNPTPRAEKDRNQNQTMMSHDVDDEQEEQARLEQEIDDGIFNESYWTEDVVHGQPTVYIDSPVLVHTVSQALDYFERCAKRNTSLRFIRIKLPTRRGSKHGTASWNATIVQDYVQLVQRLPLFRNLQMVTLLVASSSDLVIPSEELLPFELLYQLLQQPLQQQQQQHRYDKKNQQGRRRDQGHHHHAFRPLGRSSSPLYASIGKLKIRVESGTTRGERITGAGTSTNLKARTTTATTTSTAMPASQLTECQIRDLAAALCNHPSVVEFAMDSLRVPSTLDPILSMLISLPNLRSVHIRFSRRFQQSLSGSGIGSGNSSSIDSAMGGGDTPQVTGRVLTQLLCRRTLQEFVLQDIGPLQPVRFQELAAAFYPQQSIHCFSLKNIGILAASSDFVPSTATTNTNTNTSAYGNRTTTAKKSTTTPFSTATLLVGTHTIQKLVVPLPSTQASANALHHIVHEYLVSNRSVATQLDANVSPTQQGHAEMILSSLAHSTEVYPLDGTQLWSAIKTAVTAETAAMGGKEEINDSNEVNDNDKKEQPVEGEDENHDSYNDRHAASATSYIRDFFFKISL